MSDLTSKPKAHPPGGGACRQEAEAVTPAATDPDTQSTQTPASSAEPNPQDVVDAGSPEDGHKSQSDGDPTNTQPGLEDADAQSRRVSRRSFATYVAPVTRVLTDEPTAIPTRLQPLRPTAQQRRQLEARQPHNARRPQTASPPSVDEPRLARTGADQAQAPSHIKSAAGSAQRAARRAPAAASAAPRRLTLGALTGLLLLGAALLPSPGAAPSGAGPGYTRFMLPAGHAAEWAARFGEVAVAEVRAPEFKDPTKAGPAIEGVWQSLGAPQELYLYDAAGELAAEVRGGLWQVHGSRPLRRPLEVTP